MSSRTSLLPRGRRRPELELSYISLVHVASLLTCHALIGGHRIFLCTA